jgi:hypothetical protein
MSTKRISLIAVALAGTIAAGCGSDNAGSLGPAPAPSPPATTTTPPRTGGPSSPGVGGPNSAAPAKTATFHIWLVRSGKLFETARTGEQTLAVGKRALDSLLRGPSAAEAAAGVTSALPPDFQLRITDLTDGVATVDVDPRFSGDDVGLRRAQIVSTLTQYAGIRGVRFRSAGAPVTDRIFTAQDLEADLPQIIVTSPQIGAVVGNPVVVSGTANVFEATVSIRILDARGKEIAHAFTTATCGSGCRGTYSAPVRYTVSARQRGIVEVYESSAKDGSRIHVQEIPVTLVP